MQKNNPACFECPKDKQSLHYWKRLSDGTAKCLRCGLVLNEEHARECFEDRS